MRIGGNLNQKVTIREVFAGQAALLRAKDQGHAAAAFDLVLQQWGQGGQRNNPLLRFAGG